MRSRVRLRVVASVVIATCLLAGATSATADQGGESHAVASRLSVLVFARYHNDQETIWRANSDGTNPAALTPGVDAQVSPDGRWVAFSRTGAAAGLYVIPLAGGKPHLLLRSASAYGYSGFVWAPDSREIAIASRVVDARTGVARAPCATPGYQPSFSPDSTAIVYVVGHEPGSGDLYVCQLGSGSTRRLTYGHHFQDPVWGPQEIAFDDVRYDTVKGDVWLIQPDGSGLRRLTTTDLGIVPVDWSADGTRLLAWRKYLTGSNPPVPTAYAVDVASGEANGLALWGPWFEPTGLSRDGSTVLGEWGECLFVNPQGHFNGGIGTLAFDAAPGVHQKETALTYGCDPDWTR